MFVCWLLLFLGESQIVFGDIWLTLSLGSSWRFEQIVWFVVLRCGLSKHKEIKINAYTSWIILNMTSCNNLLTKHFNLEWSSIEYPQKLEETKIDFMRLLPGFRSHFPRNDTCTASHIINVHASSFHMFLEPECACFAIKFHCFSMSITSSTIPIISSFKFKFNFSRFREKVEEGWWSRNRFW